MLGATAIAIFHLSMKTISRAKGRSATAAAAYRAGSRLRDNRTGILFDYTKKRGVDHTEIVMWNGESSALWNLAEQTEKRKNSCVAREVEFSLPLELDFQEKIKLARKLCHWISAEYGVAGEFSLHLLTGSNPHCHFLFTTRQHVDGQLTKKTRILDDRSSGPIEVERMRSTWQKLLNESLSLHSPATTPVDHRSFIRRGIKKNPRTHRGPSRQIETMRRWLGRLRQELHAIRKEIASTLSRNRTGRSTSLLNDIPNHPKI
jgi:MobA/MobL family